MSQTLTASLTSGMTYTSLAVTATTDGIAAGETVWVSLGLTNVEGFTASTPTSPGATSISVVSQISSNNHSIGDAVAPTHVLTAVGRGATPATIPRGRRL